MGYFGLFHCPFRYFKGTSWHVKGGIGQHGKGSSWRGDDIAVGSTCSVIPSQTQCTQPLFLRTNDAEPTEAGSQDHTGENQAEGGQGILCSSVC